MKHDVWLFYLTNTNYPINNVYPNELYAFTDDANIANTFSMTRNMDKFFMKFSKFNKKEFKKLKTIFMKKSLVYVGGKTSDKNGKIYSVSIPLTITERIMYNSIVTSVLHENLYRYSWNSFEYFKNKYKDSLYMLLYISAHLYNCTGIQDKKLNRLEVNMISVLLSMDISKLFI